MTKRQPLMRAILAAATTAWMLIACAPAPEAEKADDIAEDIAADDHVWKDQTNALDKARDLENTLTDAEKKRREQLEDDGG